MSRWILLPFRVHPDVPANIIPVTPIGPIFTQPAGRVTTRDDVIGFYRTYLGRDPENEGAISGRVGRPYTEVEVEIATSDEAVALLEAHGIPRTVPTLPVPTVGLTDWDKRAGMLIADELARLLGMPAPPSNAWAVFAVQAHIEDAGGSSYGAQTNNPLNLRSRDGGGNLIGWQGMTGESPAGFAEFDTLEDGALACAINYTNVSYTHVVAAFRAGDLIALAQAIQDSPWDAGHYSGGLVAAVHAALPSA